MSDNKLNPNNLTASGSATGSTRNKVALKPGYSLVGWIRLTNSGEDLTGTKGKRFSVTTEELSKHSKIDDCYISIRGKVYNITRYMDYHPGGVSELFRGAGIDGTKLFDEYHPWVNIEQLLAKCYIGPLKNPISLDFNPFESTKNQLQPPSSTNLISNKEKMVEEQEDKIIIPRFDWIQRAKDLAVYFYTKSLCNAGISLTRIDEKEYKMVIYIGHFSHTYKFNFLKILKFPPEKIHVNQEIGKIEVVFEKVQEEVWHDLGVFEKICSIKSNEEKFSSWNEYTVLKATSFNHDSFELKIVPKFENKLIIFPIGYHVSFKVPELGETVRNYTPVPPWNFLKAESNSNSTEITFLIKKYDQGYFSTYLSQVDDDRSNKKILISQPKGSLDLNRLKNHKMFLMIAAGSGLTPLISCLQFILMLKRNNSKIKSQLLFFNKTFQDIWWKEQLDELSKMHEEFKVNYILSEPDKWNGGDTGRIRKDLILKFSKEASFAFVCGNSGFNQQSIKILNELKIEFHCFDG